MFQSPKIILIWILIALIDYTARPRDTRFLVPEKNCAAQNRASWGLCLCTKIDFFSKNRVTSRFLFKIRVSQVFLEPFYTKVMVIIFLVNKDDSLMTLWWLFDDSLMTLWLLFHDSFMTLSWLSDESLVTLWWVFYDSDDCLMTI